MRIIIIDELCSMPYYGILFNRFQAFCCNASLIHNVIKFIQLQIDIAFLKDRIYIRIGAQIKKKLNLRTGWKITYMALDSKTTILYLLFYIDYFPIISHTIPWNLENKKLKWNKNVS